MDDPVVADSLERPRDLVAQELDCRPAICDLLLNLVDRYGLRSTGIARRIDRRPSDFSEMLKTARDFPPAQRPMDTPYNH